MEIKNLINELDWHPVRRWSRRKLTRIDKIIIHQELGNGDVEAVNRYHIHSNHISKRGCPHFCYHYGIEKNGEIKQVNDLEHITWHTKGQNERGIGIMLVGDFVGPGHEEGDEGPTKEQMKSLGELVGYLLGAFGFGVEGVFGHCDFGKGVCPGRAVEGWIGDLRSGF